MSKYENPQDAPLRAAREAVMAGRMIPSSVCAQLEGRGINVGALERRLREGDAWRS